LNSTISAGRRATRWTLILAALIVALLMLVSSTGVADDTQPVTVLATVNGDKITSADLNAVLIKTHRTMDRNQKEGFDYRKLLDKLVNDRLLIQEASALGIAEDESLLEYLEKGRRETARRMFVRTTFKPEIEIPEAEIRDYFNEYYWKIQIRTVSVATKKDAEDLIAAIKAGAPMDSIAQAISLDSRRFKGGLHSLKYWADVDNAHRVASRGVDVGQLSKPFKFNEVYSILRVEQRLPVDTADYSKFENRTRTYLTVEARKRAWSEFKDHLQQQTPVSIDSTVLAAIKADQASLFRAGFLDGTDATVLSTTTGLNITDSELRNEVSHKAMSAGTSPFDSLLQAGINAKTEDLLLLAAADREGFLDSARIVEQYRQSLDSALVELYLQEMVVPQIVFNKAEFQTYYDEHLEDFRLPNKYDLQEIIVDSEEKAGEVRRRLKDGADWQYIAKQFSTKEPHEHNDDELTTLEVFPPRVAEDIKGLRVGQFSQAYKTTDGWIVFRVNGIRPGEFKSLQKADPDIREVMFQSKFNDILDHHLGTMKKNSIIEYNEQEIEKYFGGRP
jgi:foldase protein PrsA